MARPKSGSRQESHLALDGDKLMAAMNLRGMSSAQLAKEAGVSPTTISATLTRQRQTVTVRTARRIAAALARRPVDPILESLLASKPTEERQATGGSAGVDASRPATDLSQKQVVREMGTNLFPFQLWSPRTERDRIYNDIRFGALTPSLPGSGSIELLGLSVRAENALRAVGVTTIGQLRGMTGFHLMNIRNFGTESLKELVDKIA